MAHINFEKEFVIVSNSVEEAEKIQMLLFSMGKSWGAEPETAFHFTKGKGFCYHPIKDKLRYTCDLQDAKHFKPERPHYTYEQVKNALKISLKTRRLAAISEIVLD